MLYNQPIDHPFLGKRVDFDFRGIGTFATPYSKAENCQVWQNVIIEKVSTNTDGNTLVHFTKDGPGFSPFFDWMDKKSKEVVKLNRVVKVY